MNWEGVEKVKIRGALKNKGGGNKRQLREDQQIHHTEAKPQSLASLWREKDKQRLRGVPLGSEPTSNPDPGTIP